MTVSITPFDPAQAPDELIRGAYTVTVEAFKLDFPDRPVPAFEAYAEQLRKPISMLGPRRQWLARAEDDAQVLGVASAVFQEHENSHLCLVNIRVAPARRRAGIGTALFRDILAEVEASGRELVVTDGLKRGSDGAHWAEAHGFTPTSEILMQRLFLADAADASRQTAMPAGFRVEFWLESLPVDVVDGYAAALSGMDDAQGTLGMNQPQWSAERLRDYESEARERGNELRFAAAVREADGSLVAVTIIELAENQPEYCFQQATAVLPELRGRGLALGLKAAALRRLRAERPAIREVQTHMPTGRRAMIHVNHRLGYVDDEVIARFEAPARVLRAGLAGARARP